MLALHIRDFFLIGPVVAGTAWRGQADCLLRLVVNLVKAEVQVRALQLLLDLPLVLEALLKVQRTAVIVGLLVRRGKSLSLADRDVGFAKLTDHL